MKRSPIQRKTPLQRKPWKSSVTDQPDWRSELRSGGIKRSSLKSKPKRVTVADGAKYLEACRGEPCYLNVCCPWTDWEDPTVVPCHSNFAKHGKAGARKADHQFSVPGCMRCHAWLDAGPAPYEEKLEKFESALARWTLRRDRKMGIEQKELEVA
jgi:hypothetical protein